MQALLELRYLAGWNSIYKAVALGGCGRRSEGKRDRLSSYLALIDLVWLLCKAKCRVQCDRAKQQCYASNLLQTVELQREINLQKLHQRLLQGELQ